VCISDAFGKVDISPKKEAFLRGESITITPINKNNIIEKYTLLHLFNNGSWEVAIDQFSGPIKYEFKNNGLCSLQINTIAEDGQIIEEDWLGQFYVGPPMKYVEGISWRPMKITFRKGEKLNFLIKLAESKMLPNLEFQVLTKHPEANQWKESVAWQSWPLPEFVYAESTPLDIGINVREKDSYLAPQKIFLGNFLPQNPSFIRDNFLTAILAHHRNPETQAKLLAKSISEELNLALHILYWTYLKLPLREKIIRARSLGIGRVSEFEIHLTTSDNVNLVFDLRRSNITDGLVTISISPSNHPYVEDIFKKISDLPESVRTASLLVNFLYNHYNYSPVPERLNRPFLGVRDTNSMCLLNAVVLKNILNSLGLKVTVIAFGDYDNEKHEFVSSHAVNELFVKGQYYVLDATTNRIGLGTHQSIIKTKKIPKFIILPQAFDAEIIYKFPITSIGEIAETEIDTV
jgi:hypothetical protein